MGRLDDARKMVARLRAITPVMIPEVCFLPSAEQRELLLSGVRKAIGEATC